MTETGACKRLSIELNDKRECIEYRISKKWLDRTLKEKLKKEGEKLKPNVD